MIYAPTTLFGTPLADVWIESWVVNEDPNLAIAEVQRHELYDTYFPGNRREDGSVRYTEAQYKTLIEDFDQAIMSFGLNPDVFRAKYPDLIEGEVSAPEFVQRLEDTWEGIIDQAPQVAEYYTAEFGIPMTTEAVFASVIDPDLGGALLQGRIEIAQVGGTAAQRGFQIASDFAQRLVHAGLDTTSEAAQFFSLAQGALPTLSALASRHADPDDDFSLEEFATAQVFADPEQRNRIRRLLASERAEFSNSPGLTVRQTNTGRSSGLENR